MKFAIRDDDTNYFTQAEELEQIYQNIWEKCPISLSVVPFHASTKSGGIPARYWRGDTLFPIGKNKRLVDYLREKINQQKVSIMLHGYNHKASPYGSEFEGEGNFSEKIRIGKRYLEELFNVEIKTFVPPHNRLSNSGLESVIENGLHIVHISGRKVWKKLLKPKHLIQIGYTAYLHYKKKTVYPYVINWGTHQEVAYHSLIPATTAERLRSSFEFCHKAAGVFCLSTHYWELNKHESMLRVFNEFWEFINRFRDVQFSSVDGLFESSHPIAD